MPSTSDHRTLIALERELSSLRESLLLAEEEHHDAIAETHPAHRRSAVNLVHYVELRRHDIRELQERLSTIGLSSIGRSEAHVLATIEALLGILTRLTGGTAPASAAPITLPDGPRLLAENAERLLGRPPSTRSTRIMVTLPSEAAGSPELVSRMTAGGMDVARINCAHDDAAAWTAMIGHVRSRALPSGKRPLVAMDLGGPKVRTGPLRPGPQVVKVKPRRDHLGIVIEPAAVRLTVAGATPTDDGNVIDLPVADRDWIRRRRAGDGIELRDARGALRRWLVAQVDEHGCLVSVAQTTYVTTGTELLVEEAGGDDVDVARVGELPAIELAHRVVHGDRIVLTRTMEPAEATPAGSIHRIGCTLPEILDAVNDGDRVWLDDGKIGGIVARVRPQSIEIMVTDVRPAGANLKAGKGINVPDCDLAIDALTGQDLVDLDVAARHADIVSLSFVRRASDVARLQAELAARGASELGIVLKIENVRAFENLPELLLTALRSRKVGVMIARGDLAVEVGFERLAEVQEEIMWICEAAHVPVIWATQVLDTLARTGQPSRAEVTDAAMGERAECVMLNKGPHIVEAIGVLDSILSRMQHHQRKKGSLLRRLRAWDHPSASPSNP